MSNSIVVSSSGKSSPAYLYLASLNSERSRYTMEQGLRTLVRVLTKGASDDPFTFPFEHMRRDLVLTLRLYLIEHYSARTVNTYLYALKGVLRECWRAGTMSHEDFARCTDFKTVPVSESPKGKVPSDADIKALINEALKAPEPFNLYDAAIINTLYATGFRRHEIFRLREEDIVAHEYAHRVLLRLMVKGKGGKIREVLMPYSDHLTHWREYRNQFMGDGWTFAYPGTFPGRLTIPHPQYLYDMLMRYGEPLFGDHWYRPHDFRRYYVTRLLQGGVDLLTVSRLVGHAQIETTKAYDKRSFDADAQILIDHLPDL